MRSKLFRYIAVVIAVLFSMTSMTVPAKAAVTDLGPEIVGISANDNFTCMNAKTGEVYCWGQSTNSNLGTGMESDNAVPHQVYGIHDSLKVLTGDSFACSLSKSGFVSCWGKNDIGQVGDGIIDYSDRIFPSVVAMVRDVIDIAVGDRHACALISSGNVYCWGDDKFGQLGDFTHPTSNLVQRKLNQVLPTMVDIPQKITSLAAGSNHTCGLAELKIVYCWGSNLTGQLGIGLQNISISRPEVVPGLLNVISIKSHYDSTCARTSNSGMYCWGKGSNGELGELETVNRYLPRLMSGTYSVTNPATNVATAYTYATSISNFAFGLNGGCGIDARSGLGYLVCWGKNTGYEPTSTQALDVALGKNHGCMITISYMVACWGTNLYGQTGANIKNATWQSSTILKGIPEWKNYIVSWGISYTTNIATLTWTGAAESKFYLSVEPFGFTCEVISVFNCQIGPLQSNTEYKVLLVAKGSSVANSRSAAFSFKTGALSSTLSEAKAISDAATQAISDAAKKEAEIAAATAKAELLSQLKESRLALALEFCNVKQAEIKKLYLDLIDSATNDYGAIFSSLNTATMRIHEKITPNGLKLINQYKSEFKVLLSDLPEYKNAISNYSCEGNLETDNQALLEISNNLSLNYKNSIFTLAAISNKWKKLLLYKK